MTQCFMLLVVPVMSAAIAGGKWNAEVSKPLAPRVHEALQSGMATTCNYVTQDIIELAEPLLEPSRVANGERLAPEHGLPPNAPLHKCLPGPRRGRSPLPAITGSSYPLRTSSSCFLAGQQANEPVRSSHRSSLPGVRLQRLRCACGSCDFSCPGCDASISTTCSASCPSSAWSSG